MEDRRSNVRLSKAVIAPVAVAATMLAAACGSNGTSTSAASSVGSVASPAALSLTSTLDGATGLPVRTHWEATPSLPADEVAEVDFLIDDQLAWVEHETPYFYGSDGNWLVTTFLSPGQHTFTVRAIGSEGQTATDPVQALVSPPPKPPTDLVGVWSRNVPDLGQDAGRWRITINSIGWLFDDPNGGGENQDVSYPASGKVLVRAAIEEPPYGTYARGGAFCEEPDPLGLYTFRVSDDGETLTLKSVKKDCRQALLEGTWSRVAT